MYIVQPARWSAQRWSAHAKEVRSSILLASFAPLPGYSGLLLLLAARLCESDETLPSPAEASEQLRLR